MDPRWTPSTTTGELRKTVLMLRGKKSGLYVKDIYGTRIFGQKRGALFIKMTPLYRELILRAELSAIKDKYNHLASMGMLGWPTYNEERTYLNCLLQLIYRRIDAYKERRLEAGLFYIRPARNNKGPFKVHSPLFGTPVKQALKRRRRQMKRGDILGSYNNGCARAIKASPSATVAAEHMMNLLKYTIASIFIGCIIVLS
ncbi:hypothetical protein EJB05_40201 [Eragrostis curvula]|uniref:Uncharacterized protein n=1 Tax=Eragrostis curvula TaxID=38414 RepID=A0A5J9U0E6_9POAL|nr:hypothetical protein EJB05_40201 [Eragrostis curvula]